MRAIESLPDAENASQPPGRKTAMRGRCVGIEGVDGALGPRKDRSKAPSMKLLVSGSLESDLGEAPQLARVQPLPLLCLKMLKGLEANLEVLTDALAVEFVRHSSKLDVAVQRLVRDTQQCAVGHAE